MVCEVKTNVCDNEYQELMKRADILCKDMVLSDIRKDIIPVDPQDQSDVEVTMEYRESDNMYNLITRWLTGDM